jgi:predicted membrane protein
MDENKTDNPGADHPGTGKTGTGNTGAGNPSPFNPGGTPEKTDWRGKGGHGRVWTGLFLLVIGGVLLLDQMGFPFPDWLFNWHCLLIVIGLFIGFRSNFRGVAWLILILIGSFYIAKDNYPDLPVDRFIWPAVLIGVGLLFILRPHHRRWGDEGDRRYRRRMDRERWKERHEWRHHERPASTNWSQARAAGTTADFLDSTAIFGGSHKKVVTKTFRGGDITSIMGGTEIDLTQADINGTVILDVTQVMGGTKIIVPAHWEVRSEVTAVFAGFEDKRQQPAVINPDKILIIQGTSIFGGIELRNY